jgi:hypothetical protein
MKSKAVINGVASRAISVQRGCLEGLPGSPDKSNINLSEVAAAVERAVDEKGKKIGCTVHGIDMTVLSYCDDSLYRPRYNTTHAV